jgi:hypothetical protein
MPFFACAEPAYVRFVNVGAETGAFFSVQDSKEIQVSAVESEHVSPYMAVEQGYIEVKAHNSGGLMMVKRSFVAAESNHYTVLFSGGARAAIMVSNAEDAGSDKFSGSYCNTSKYVMSCVISRIEGEERRVVAAMDNVKPMTCQDYGKLDFGLYSAESRALWTVDDIHVRDYFNVHNSTTLDMFIFAAPGKRASTHIVETG